MNSIFYLNITHPSHLLISAHGSATSFSFLTGQVSLLRSILLLTQLLYSLPFLINDISLMVSNGTNCLNLFHAIWILARIGRRSSRTFSSDFDIFRRRVVVHFFNSDFKFFTDRSESLVTSLYIVFISSSKFMLIFLLYNKSSVVAEMGDRLATIDMG